VRGSAFQAGFGRVTAAVGPLLRLRAARRLQRLFTDAHVRLYRLLGGRLVGRIGPAPVLLLTTTGRRSGRRRTLPVIYVPGEDPLLVASNGGAPQHPHWYRNLLAEPHAEIVIGRAGRRVVAEIVEGPERDSLWARAVAVYPPYAHYQRRSARRIPVVVLRSG
jgi:deazaflavin-dependent oxidoreductase (nitroreductase family)